MIDLMQIGCYYSLNQLFEEISKFKKENVSTLKTAKTSHVKIILFVYREIFDFPGYDQEINVFLSKNVLDSALNLMFNDVVIHHSHISGNIIEYVHDFCNQKVKENKQTTSAFAHNLFRFDFFFIVKGLRICVWKTKNLNMGGKGTTNLNYANMGDQVKFIDTIKFYQEPLSTLAASMEPNEKENIRRSMIYF